MNILRLAAARAACALAAWASLGAAHAAGAEPLRVGGTGSGMGTMQVLAEAYGRADPSFQIAVVPNLGSSGGIKALLAGAVQVAVISRPLKPEEAAQGLRAIEYGRTPFVLTTTKADVRNLSLAEVAGLYAGRRTQWADGSPVRLVLRPVSDFDSSLLASFSPEVKDALAQAQSREGMVVGMTDQDAVDSVERLPGAIGTATVALLRSEKRRAHALSIDGVEPTGAHLQSGRYPFGKTMSLVVRADAGAAVQRFVQFVQSEPGRRVLADLGHVPAAPGLVAVRP